MALGGKRPGAGRKKGSKATHTLEAEKAKQELIRMYIENCRPIHQALIDKAKSGDISAIKELFERVHGKVPQTLGGDKNNPIILQGVEIFLRQ